MAALSKGIFLIFLDNVLDVLREVLGRLAQCQWPSTAPKPNLAHGLAVETSSVHDWLRPLFAWRLLQLQAAVEVVDAQPPVCSGTHACQLPNGQTWPARIGSST